MRKVREVLRLHLGAGLSTRQIARSCNIGRSTVAEYIQRARNAGLSWPLPADMDDTQLEAVLFKRPNCNTKRPQPDMHYVHTEMRKKASRYYFCGTNNRRIPTVTSILNSASTTGAASKSWT